MGQIIDFTVLPDYAARWRSENRSVVVTNGCFDLLHLGHLRTFQAAKQFGDLLVVGLNSDTSVRRLKGDTRPMISQDYRAELVAALEPVDYVTIFNDSTADRLLETIQPQVYVKGGDYNLDSLPERETILKYNIRLQLVQVVQGVSTTELIRKIKTANI